MKKLLLTVLTVILVLGSTNVSAMTKDELKAKLTKTYTINGVEVKATNSQIAQIERYFSQNEISEEDATYIANKIDEAIAIVEAGNAKELKDLTKTEKDKLKALVNDISNHTSVKATVLKGGVIRVYNNDGTYEDFTDLIKYTDNSNVILMVAGAISLLGVAVITRKIAKANA